MFLRSPIKSFKDLEVYQRSYKSMLIVMKQLMPKLPESEKYDLKDQLSRSCKAVPRLIAEGYAKKHQVNGFRKYLDDAHSEANETIVGIEQSKDIYNIDMKFCNSLSAEYEIISKQLFRLAETWTNFTPKAKVVTPVPASPPNTPLRSSKLQPEVINPPASPPNTPLHSKKIQSEVINLPASQPNTPLLSNIITKGTNL